MIVFEGIVFVVHTPQKFRKVDNPRSNEINPLTIDFVRNKNHVLWSVLD